MASHPAPLGRASALPFDIALAVIPSLPRPLLARFVARAIDHLNEQDGDADTNDTSWSELWSRTADPFWLSTFPEDNEDEDDAEHEGGWEPFQRRGTQQLDTTR